MTWTIYDGFIKRTFRLTTVLMLQTHTPSSQDFEHSSFANNARIDFAAFLNNANLL